MNRGEAISLAKRRHGHSRRGMRSPEYLTWCSMLKRCNNPSQQNYKDYGHEYTPQNTRVDGRGARNCRACHAGRGREQRRLAHLAPGGLQNVVREMEARKPSREREL